MSLSPAFGQAVAQPHQHAFAGAVGAENHRAWSGLDTHREAVNDGCIASGKRQSVQFQRQHRSTVFALRKFADHRGQRIEQYYQADQHDAQPQRQR